MGCAFEDWFVGGMEEAVVPGVVWMRNESGLERIQSPLCVSGTDFLGSQNSDTDYISRKAFFF